MNRRILYIGLWAALFAACTAPEPQRVHAPQSLVLTATQEGGPDTRTVIQEETQVHWEPGDAVKVFFDGSSSRFTTVLDAPAPVARFTGTLDVLIGFNEGFSAETPLWGLYPWREDATADNVSVTTTLPAEQEARAGSFAQGTYITLGRSDHLTMGFYGVCGGVRFTLTQEGIRQISLESLDGSPLAGRVRVAFTDGVPVVQEVSDGRSVLTMKVPEGGTFETGVWYSFVALPGTLEGGIKLGFRQGNRYGEKNIAHPLTIKRAIFGSLAEVDRDVEFGVPGGGADEEIIHFADPGIRDKLVAAFDTDGDGCLSFGEARAVTSIKGAFGTDNTFTSFDEFRFFTGVTEIPDLLFRGWTQLSSIWIPDSVTRIGKFAFHGCSALTSVEIPESVTVIDRNAFNGCIALPEIRLPDGLTEVGDWAFNKCTSFRSIRIPDQVGTIGNNAFSACSQLREIDLPESLTSLNQGLFQGDSLLRSVTIPRSVNTIGAKAFSGCISLKEIEIPTSVISIGGSAFEYCTGLEEIEIPVAVSTLGGGVLLGCSALKAIYIRPATPPSGGDRMFDDTGDCPIYVPGASSQDYATASYWKNYVSRLQSDDGSSLFYTSTDYSRDGEVVLLQQASVGRGVNFILMGDGFVDTDMVPGGKYEQRMRSAMEALFAYEPYRSQRSRFNVYTVKVVSANAQYGYTQSNRRLTYESGGDISFRSSVCLSYGRKAPSTTGQPVKIAVLCNSESRVGRSYCLRYSNGEACCIVFDPNPDVLVHELCGHGFGDLWDEYSEKSETFTDHSGLDRDWTSRQWGANTDWRSDPSTVRWAHFLSDSRYAAEGLGIFEGAKTYASGIYRPSYNSMMRHNNCPFNAPSREQIYKNIMKWSVGSGWQYDYETFVAADAAGREQAMGRLRSLARGTGEEAALQRHYAENHIPPVLVDDDETETSVPLEGRPVVKILRRKR